MVTFEYGGKYYTTENLDNKLRKLGITEEDIKICKKQDCRIGEPDVDKKLYYFYNEKTKETIVSIYDNLLNLNGLINIKDWLIC